ncbi:SDR family oxidoreductase [Paenibacillus sp. y28]|uniref:SDR family oxidoreductase n=1 Tax=Paenibacillus sp. y28 TaxID=3129110 RepID=UPI00301612F5
MKILVTGATGKLGSLVVDELLKIVPSDTIAVSVRDPQKAVHLQDKGIDVRYGNFNDYDSLVTAFTGIDRLFIISSDDVQKRTAQHLTAVRAAQAANVTFIAYTSAPKATYTTVEPFQDHRMTEEAIATSGLAYSILRNNWYLENEVNTFQAVLNGMPWIIASSQGKAGWASRRDYAEAAARVLTGPGHENSVYELSGEPLTQKELADIFAEVTQQEVQLQYFQPEEYGQMLAQSGIPDAFVPILVHMQVEIGRGALEMESSDLQRLLGRPATPLKDALSEIIKELAKGKS